MLGMRRPGPTSNHPWLSSFMNINELITPWHSPSVYHSYTKPDSCVPGFIFNKRKTPLIRDKKKREGGKKYKAQRKKIFCISFPFALIAHLEHASVQYTSTITFSTSSKTVCCVVRTLLTSSSHITLLGGGECEWTIIILMNDGPAQALSNT